MPSRRALLAAGLACTTASGGCTSLGRRRSEPAPTDSSGTGDVGAGPFWSTVPHPTGNPTLPGSGDLRGVAAVRIPVEDTPRWLVAHPAPAGSYWTLVAAGGAVTRWQVRDGVASEPTGLGTTTSTAPPVVAGDTDPRVLERPAGIGRHAGELVVRDRQWDGPRRVYVAGDGDLVVEGRERHRLPLDAPTDVRPALISDGRVAVYGDATGRYRHGALGDRIEPSSIAIVALDRPSIRRRTALVSPSVFEGLRPLVADLDGDGASEIVTTVATAETGARIGLFSSTGERVATGAASGPGWRHQLCVAPFGPDGAQELAVVLRPHVTRRLEFYRRSGSRLTVSASIDGFSTHRYGSRNVDVAVAADLDDDGTAELLLPTSDRRQLAVVERVPGGARTAWRWDLGAPFETNLAGVGAADGSIAVGVATADELLIWSA